MSAIGSALSGLQASMTRLNTSAANIARAADPAANVDMTSELVNQLDAGLAFKANARVIETVNRLNSSAIEFWA